MSLSEQEVEEIRAEMAVYEDPKAAAIDCLLAVQTHRGWISDTTLSEIAAFMGVSTTTLEGVATFYNLVFRQPVGRHVLMVCDSISCYLCGYDKVMTHLKSTLGIEMGQTSADDRFTLLPICCLGDCDHAPSMRIDEDYHGGLTPERIDEILTEYK